MLLFIIKTLIIFFFFGIEYYINKFYKDNISRSMFINLATVFNLLVTLYIIIFPIKWTPFTIPKILLFIFILIFIWISDESILEYEAPFVIGIMIIFISYIVAFIFLVIGFEENVMEAEKTANSEIISINSLNNGDKYNEPVYVLFCEETEEYRFYTENEDGSIKHNNISSNKIKIYFIEENEKPYIDTFTSYVYTTNKYTNYEKVDEEILTYNIYVQKDYFKTIYFLKDE